MWPKMQRFTTHNYKQTHMKRIAIPVCMALLAFTGTAMAQAKKTAPAPAAAPAPAPAAATTAAAPAGKLNKADIEGKWKVELVDIDMKTPDGEAMKNSLPGGDDDFFEFKAGTLTSYLSGQSENVPYSIAGGYLITRSEGITDSTKIMSLSKTKCVLYKKEESAEGSGQITITLKK